MSNVAPPYSTSKPSHREQNPFLNALTTQCRVIYAIMMHDIKSRFFGNGLGYVMTILWPTVHIAVIVGAFYFIGRHAPYGESPLLYASIGVLPYIVWSYISRFTIIGVLQNRPFLQYPLVKPLDLMIGRQALELVTTVIITIAMILFLAVCGIDPMPHRLASAVYALFSAMLLGVGFGILGAVMTMIFPFFSIVYIALIIVAWVSSGLVINPEAMPEQVGRILAWNPLLHSVEWMRYAYYDDFPAHLLDRTYVFGVGASALTLGLFAERLLRILTMR